MVRGFSSPHPRRLAAILAPLQPACDRTPPARALHAPEPTVGGAASPARAAGLGRDQLDSFRRDGYILVKGAATPEQVGRVERSMFAQLSMTPEDSEGWN